MPRAQPKTITIANSGTGSHTHFTSVALFKAAGAEVIDVPFGGAQVIPFLLGGWGYGNIGQASESPGIASAALPGTFRPYGSTFQTAVASTTLTNAFAVAFTPAIAPEIFNERFSAPARHRIARGKVDRAHHHVPSGLG